MSEHTNYRQVRWNNVAIAVSALIGLALLLPAIRPTPDRRRPHCMNHLKQLTLSVTNFEVTKKKYPGIQSSFGDQQNRGKIGPWVVSLLPYLEEQTARDLWDSTASHDEWEAAWLKPVSEPISPFYPDFSWLRCPADERFSNTPGLTNYIANAGFYLLPNDPALELPSYAEATDDSQRSTISQRSANGVFVNQLPTKTYDPRTKQFADVFGVAKAVRSTEIRDGLSSTVAFVETSKARTWRTISITDDEVRYRVGAIWLYADHKTSPNRPEPMQLTSSMLLNGNLVDQTPSPVSARPSSNHRESFNTAMLDGSVRSVSIQIDYVVYQSLMTPVNNQSDMPDHRHVLRPREYE